MKFLSIEEEPITATFSGFNHFFVCADYASMSHFGGIAAVLVLAADRSKFNNIPKLFELQSNGGQRPTVKRLRTAEIKQYTHQAFIDGYLTLEERDQVLARFA